MTKFEEEVNKYNIFERTVYLEGGPKKILIDHFKNWHSDEEFQAEKDARKKEYEIHQDIYSKTSKKLNEAELEIANLKSQFQQQALPVVPECVAELFNEYRLENIQRLFEFGIDDIKSNKMIKALMWRDKHPDTFSLAFITGNYQVEKPQLFYIALPKVYGLSDSTFVSKAESGIISEFTKGKDYALKLTEQEIKSIDERYWQFAVPVEV